MADYFEKEGAYFRRRDSSFKLGPVDDVWWCDVGWVPYTRDRGYAGRVRRQRRSFRLAALDNTLTPAGSFPRRIVNASFTFSAAGWRRVSL
jgi:hypothetical protein